MKQKYPSIHRHYEFEMTLCETKEPKKNSRKTKSQSEKENKRIVSSLKWKIKEGVDINARSGIYFLKASLEGNSEETIWQCYNTIREIEATFRVLKTELDLRPIYHKNDDSTMAHLHLGLLAYWMVNTVRYQLKKKESISVGAK